MRSPVYAGNRPRDDAACVARLKRAGGTQTNGSVIRPAAYCGVVGFKPTKDAIPFPGVHLFSATLDQLGTFTRSVADAARLASALADPGRIAPAPSARGKPPRLAYLDGFDAVIAPSAPGAAPAGLDSTGDPSCCTL